VADLRRLNKSEALHWYLSSKEDDTTSGELSRMAVPSAVVERIEGEKPTNYDPDGFSPEISIMIGLQSFRVRQEDLQKLGLTGLSPTERYQKIRDFVLQHGEVDWEQDLLPALPAAFLNKEEGEDELYKEAEMVVSKRKRNGAPADGSRSEASAEVHSQPASSPPEVPAQPLLVPDIEVKLIINGLRISTFYFRVLLTLDYIILVYDVRCRGFPRIELPDDQIFEVSIPAYNVHNATVEGMGLVFRDGNWEYTVLRRCAKELPLRDDVGIESAVEQFIAKAEAELSQSEGSNSTS